MQEGHEDFLALDFKGLMNVKIELDVMGAQGSGKTLFSTWLEKQLRMRGVSVFHIGQADLDSHDDVLDAYRTTIAPVVLIREITTEEK